MQAALMLFGCLLILNSCKSAQNSPGDFNLLPLPQLFEISGVSALSVEDLTHYFSADGDELPVVGELLAELIPAENHSGAQLSFKIDPSLSLKTEGYALEIEQERITITGKDRAGLLYGFMTLEQLMTDAKEQGVKLPLCSIRDFPLLSYRAIHLDVKHHLEKKDYYYRLMDKLAQYKVNAIILEVEDKLAYERQPLVGSEDALSIEEWKNLSDYALERNIEISPLVQGLGHASFILKHEQYAGLRDDLDSDWAFNPLDPGTYDVQFDLYLDAFEAMPHGRYLHVGGDEVHTTGRGSGKTELELQLTWLNKVCKFAEDHGRIPIFWDDMPLKYAGLYRPMFQTNLSREKVDSIWAADEHKLVEYLDLFPKNCIYMRWNYSHPQAEGNIKAMEWFSENGMQVMGATAGQTRWVLMPQNESNMENIRSFSQSSIEKGIDGLLLTLWDDDSPHFELYMRGILAFAEYSWSGDQRTKDEIKAAFRQREYAHALAGAEYGFVDRLELMTAWWNRALLKGSSRNALKSMNEPLKDGIIDLPLADQKGEWSKMNEGEIELARKILEDSEAVAETLSKMKQQANRNQYRLDVYAQVNELIRFSAHALLALDAYDIALDEADEAAALIEIEALPGKLASLREEMEGVYGETRILNKPGGYMLDQDHHHHLANQTLSFDWLYTAELYFLEKTKKEILFKKVDLADKLQVGQLEAVNRTLSPYDDSEAVEMNAAEGSGLGILKGIAFKTGTIEVELLGENNPGKSFIGIAFNIEDEDNYEAIYFRPFNFVASEQIRKEHMVQYIHHPKDTWYSLREERTGEFENEITVPPDPDKWFRARIVVSEKSVSVFVNDIDEAVLTVERLATSASNKIGLWTGHGSSGRFKDLILTK